MSPASAGPLEVERYIGACLISSQQSRHKKQQYTNHQDVFRRSNNNPSTDRWAGGMPLIHLANQQRWTGHQHHHQEQLTRLAVHTQGVPLILSNNKYRKNKARTKLETKKEVCPDAVSVASDESSGSANSDTCLPRIIKPRKRRKKDRKPPHLLRPADGFFSTDSNSPDILTPQSAPYEITLHNDASETPKLHHSFEDVQEVTDVNGNIESLCQCRYCDPSGQIWDIDRSCYSPFLTSPSFQFPTGRRRSGPTTLHDLTESLSTCTLVDTRRPLHRRTDLEVSTEIVTSLNGHRDLEIKFFSSSSSDKSETADE